MGLEIDRCLKCVAVEACKWCRRAGIGDGALVELDFCDCSGRCTDEVLDDCVFEEAVAAPPIIAVVLVAHMLFHAVIHICFVTNGITYHIKALLNCGAGFLSLGGVFFFVGLERQGSFSVLEGFRLGFSSGFPRGTSTQSPGFSIAVEIFVLLFTLFLGGSIPFCFETVRFAKARYFTLLLAAIAIATGIAHAVWFFSNDTSRLADGVFLTVTMLTVASSCPFGFAHLFMMELCGDDPDLSTPDEGQTP